jgi:hypothetical protein
LLNSLTIYSGTDTELLQNENGVSIADDKATLKFKNGAYVQVKSKVKIANASKNLFTVLDGIMTQLQNLTTINAANGVPPLVSQTATITTLKADLAVLME